MFDMQRFAFDWIATQSSVTGLALIGGGLLCALSGSRFTRFLIAVFAVLVGSAIGLAIAIASGVSPLGMTAAIALAAGFAALLWPVTVLVALSGFGWALVATYGTYQFGMKDDATLVAFGLGFLGGSVLTGLNRATMTVLLTSIVGSAVAIVGFVGIANGIIPSLGGTLRQLAASQPLTIPILLGMLTVTTYSFQANSFRGDLITGGVPESVV